MRWLYDLWTFLPYVVAALAATTLALGCFAQLRSPRRWFAFGVVGFLLWVVGFACVALHVGDLSYFEKERIVPYARWAFLSGGVALCVFGINYLSYHVTISSGKGSFTLIDSSAQNLHGSSDQ